MSIGMILLVIVAILAIFGVLQRVLDRMRLNDRQALIMVAAIFIGGLLPDIPVTPMFSINIGGALIPVIICVVLFIKAGTAKERFRSIAASILAAAAVYGLSYIMPTEPESEWFDVSYIYGPVAGLIAYLFGRSRRCAFIAGVMGILLADTAVAVMMNMRGTPIPLRLGSAGAFDAVVISGLLAVLLAEGIGELLERAQGGSKHTDKKFENGEFVVVDSKKEGDRS